MSSDFWLNKMRTAGTAPAPSAPPQAGLTPQGTPWWAHPTYAKPEPPQPQPQQIVQAPAPGAYRTAKAQSARATERCPHCGSDEYWKPTERTQPLCNQCHYPVQNSTQGMAISNQDSPARPSLHQAKGAGYRPDVIVGRM